MASRVVAVLGVLLVIGFVQPSLGEILFSSLKQTLIVTGTTTEGQTLHAGVDKITVSWSLNQSLPLDTDSAYKKIKILLCYAPVSQKDRGWRKTEDHLNKDKTCQFTISEQTYSAKGTFEYTVQRTIPTATYFIRAYALDSSDKELAYGQTTNTAKATNLFNVEGITGLSKPIEIAAGVFSAFSIISLVYFFVVEKRKKH